MNTSKWAEIYNHLRNYVIEEVYHNRKYPSITHVYLTNIPPEYLSSYLKDCDVAFWLIAKHVDEPHDRWYRSLISLSKVDRAHNPTSAAIYDILANRIDANLRHMNEGGIDGDEGQHSHAEDTSPSGQDGSALPQDGTVDLVLPQEGRPTGEETGGSET